MLRHGLKTRGLKHIATGAGLARGTWQHTIDDEAVASGLFEICHYPQKRGFAAARWAYKADKFSFFNIKAHVFQRMNGTIPVANVRDKSLAEITTSCAILGEFYLWQKHIVLSLGSPRFF